MCQENSESQKRMENNNMASSSDVNKMAIMKELLKGRDLSKQLHEVLFLRHGSNNGDGYEASFLVPFAKDLANNILTSFTHTLLLLNCVENIPVSASPKSEGGDDTDETGKTSNTRSGRGCYQRKRALQMWEKESPILVDDGYAWRKYGQKMTMNAKYQRIGGRRNYYRCSHKNDHGCPAMKQVQRMQEKPPLYRTTYFGLHICKNQPIPEIPSDVFTSSDSSSLLSFNNNTSSLPVKQDHPFFSTPKKEQEISSDHHIDVKVKQNRVFHQEHITSVLSSTLDRFSSVKVQSISEVDDVILKCFEFDESVRFGL